jgi:hypothetical protein
MKSCQVTEEQERTINNPIPLVSKQVNRKRSIPTQIPERARSAKIIEGST